MSALGEVIQAVESYDTFVAQEVRRARTDPQYAADLRQQWGEVLSRTETVSTPTGLKLPRVALPHLDEPGEIARYLHSQGAPGQFPYVNAAYPTMYAATNPQSAIGNPQSEEPTRLFAGLGLAEDTNRRFHYLIGHQRSARLSTAFDGPTLYGVDSDADGALGKIGEGGVAVDTVEDMLRLYDRFDLGADRMSVSMTINGPAPAILAMYVAAAKRRFGPSVVAKLRGTIQADILKEVQAQNEVLFPLDASLRFLTDMVEWTTANMPRWYPISISGYHIAEAGATPVQQAAYTLSNGLAYVQFFRERGMDVNQFGPRLSFFLDCGLDVEYLVLARVCRKIWAVAMRDVFKADARSQLFKLHTQTSGRSLIAREFRNNLTRTAIELMLAYVNATNSSHSNSADEPFTTPSEDYARLASNAQAILLEESGLFKHTTNLFGSSPGMIALEQAVERAILDEFRQIEELGGVLAAVEHRYQRSQIQSAAHRYEQQIHNGVRPIVGLNVYRSDGKTDPAATRIVRTPLSKQRRQIARVKQFKRRHAKQSGPALDRLEKAVVEGRNVFAELIETVEHCTLGQITARLHEVVGHYRPTV
jgi:methylmalonyl-CoA mutase cobalamin-binding domain/chain